MGLTAQIELKERISEKKINQKKISRLSIERQKNREYRKQCKRLMEDGKKISYISNQSSRSREREWVEAIFDENLADIFPKLTKIIQSQIKEALYNQEKYK